MCRYNRWMNQKLFAACSELSDELRKADRGAFFRSIHGTFNHILLADRLWLGRFSGVPYKAKSLDEELYADWDELRRERERTDADIEAWVNTLSEEKLAEDFHFTRMSDPEPMTRPLWVCALHVFNHQTHHRGQITTLMEQVGCDSGVTDLPVLPGGFGPSAV
jgi:uncharacterized damage-inducible protein DinB